jgi:hypothetical protein
MKKVFSILAALALLLAGCIDPTMPGHDTGEYESPWDMSSEPDDSWEEIEDDDDPEPDNLEAMQLANIKASIVFADVGEFIAGVNEETVAPGTPITVITLPEEGVWTVELTPEPVSKPLK